MNKDQAPPNTPPGSVPDRKVLTPWEQEHLKYVGGTPTQPTIVPVKTALEREQTDLKRRHLKAEEPLEETLKLKPVKDLPKSQSFADKLPKLKETRLKRLRRRLILLVSLFGIAALGTIYYVSPLSNLNQIEVVGNTHVSDESIALATNLTRDDRIWQAYFAKETIPNIKKANPRIKSVDVSLSRFNNLKLNITEYQEIAYIEDKETLHPVLENGKILTETSEVIEEDYPVLINFAEGTNLNDLLKHFPEIDQEIKKDIKEIKSTPSDYNEFLMTLTMADGNKVIASSKDYYTKINYYPKVVAEMDGKGVIDMEAGIFSTTNAALKKEKEELAQLSGTDEE